MTSVINRARAQLLNLNLFPNTTGDGKPMVRICRGAIGLANLNDFDVSFWLSGEEANVRHQGATASRSLHTGRS